MASNSSNFSFSLKNLDFNSLLNMSRSKKSSNIEQVKEKIKQLKSSGNNGKSNKLKWYDVIVKNAESGSRTVKKPRSSIPIICKNESPETSCCIRITNLTRKVTIDCLREIFSAFGTIKKLDLHFNYYDRMSKGFSYIMFSTSEEAENAVKTMNRCEIDGHEIICEQWLLPYVEFRVSSILRGAYSGVGYQRNSSRCLSPSYISQYSSQLDGLRSNYQTLKRSTSNSNTHHDFVPPNKSLSESSRRSCSKSPRPSRLRSRSNSSRIYHSKSSKKYRSKNSRNPY